MAQPSGASEVPQSPIAGVSVGKELVPSVPAPTLGDDAGSRQESFEGFLPWSPSSPSAWPSLVLAVLMPVSCPSGSSSLCCGGPEVLVLPVHPLSTLPPLSSGGEGEPTIPDNLKRDCPLASASGRPGLES